MNSGDKARVFDFLVTLLNKRGDPPDKVSALMEYFRETSSNNSEEELLHRASGIFRKDITNIYGSHVAAEIEVARHRIEALEKRVLELEQSRQQPSIQWPVIQGIGWFVSMSAALLALYLGLKP